MNWGWLLPVTAIREERFENREIGLGPLKA